jgi:4-amino-4-deoxy-L-arabinose transferase-like glycosyltransferase
MKYLIIFILLLAATLRLVALDKFPAGLNADEAAIGYNAWSLLETGKDEHSTSWPLVFRSFDDYKPPIYFYLVLPFIKVLGLNIWAVRLPSAILGVASVYLIYLIAQKLFVISTKNKNHILPVLSALILAVSPWHLQFSRGGWEVNAALFFILLGVWGFLKGLTKPKYFYLFVTSFVISIYTYHSARLISPLLALGLIILYWKDLFDSSVHLSKMKIVFSAASLGIVLSLPLAAQLLSKEGQSRFTGVSVFSDTGPLWQALEMRREHGTDDLMVKTLHNRYLSYGLRFTKNYLSHFSPRFLFVTGDEIARSKVPGMGQTYLFLAPFYLIGLLVLLKLDTKPKKFILFWFLISPLAASLTFQSPHALRSQNMVIPLTLLCSLGIVTTLDFLKKISLPLVLPLFSLLLCLSGSYYFARYLHLYYVHYPKELSYAWQYGFDQIASYTQENYDKYDHIIISDRYDQPYILMAFFLKYPPQKLQQELVMTPRDQFGFSTARKLGKYEFRAINYGEDKKLKNTLIVSADESVDDKAVINTVYDPLGTPMFKFIATP